MSGLLEKYLQQAGSDVGDAMAFGNYLSDDLFYLATSPQQAEAAAFILISAAANIAVQLTVIHGINTTDGVQKQLGKDIHFLMEGMLSWRELQAGDRRQEFSVVEDSNHGMPSRI